MHRIVHKIKTRIYHNYNFGPIWDKVNIRPCWSEVITSSHIATRLKNDKLTCNIIFCKPNYNLYSTWAQVKTSTQDGQKLNNL